MAAKRSLQFSLQEAADSSKRFKPDEQLTPSQLVHSEPTTDLVVGGLLVNVSPIKNKRFVGELVDESESIPLVGFDHVKHQQLLAVAKSPSKMLKLNKCDLQLNKFSKKPEIMVKRHTIVSESSRELNVPDTDTIGSKSISISDLTSMKEGDKVNACESH